MMQKAKGKLARRFLTVLLAVRIIGNSPEMRASDTRDVSIRAGASYGWFSNIDDAASLLLDRNNGYPSLDLAIGFSCAPKDSSYIHDAWNYPIRGFGFSVSLYDRLTPNSTRDVKISNIYNLYIYSENDIIRTPKLSFGISSRAGIGYTREIYDPISNRGNWFLGSHFSLYISLGAYLKYYVAPQLELGLSPVFWHHSNGRTRIPNVGLNEYGLELSARYHLGEQYRGKPMHYGRNRKASGHKWDIYAGAAPYMSRAQQIGMPGTQGGTPNLRAVIGGDILWNISHIYATGVQADIFYTSDTQLLEECDMILLEKTSPHGYHPIQAGISSAHELRLNEHLSLCGSIGIYLYNETGLYEDHGILFEKLGAKYCFPRLGNIFIGFNCRAYNCVRADNMEFIIGKRF